MAVIRSLTFPIWGAGENPKLGIELTEEEFSSPPCFFQPTVRKNYILPNLNYPASSPAFLRYRLFFECALCPPEKAGIPTKLPSRIPETTPHAVITEGGQVDLTSHTRRCPEQFGLHKHHTANGVGTITKTRSAFNHRKPIGGSTSGACSLPQCWPSGECHCLE